MANKKLQLAVTVIILILAAVAAVYFIFYKKTAKPPSGNPAANHQVDVGPVLPNINPLSNPVGGNVPNLNPVEKTNPFKNIYKNPF